MEPNLFFLGVSVAVIAFAVWYVLTTKKHQQRGGGPELVKGSTPKDHDILTDRDRAACVPVSRHGFEEHGVICPRCNEVAVLPGDWEQVHRIEKIYHYEEGVSCLNCGSFLLASPNDDIDPIIAGKAYDPAIYHQFVRPEGWKPPRQRVHHRRARPGEWVVVKEGTLLDGIDIGNNEGRLLDVEVGDVDTGRVMLAGMGQKPIDLPMDRLEPMVFNTVKPGSRVEFIRGRYLGEEGVIVGGRGGQLRVQLDDGPIISTPIERTRPIYPSMEEPADG